MTSLSVIFDLNGTLVDTESAYFLAYRDVLKNHGIAFTIEEFTDNWSTKGKKLHDYLETIGRQDLLPMSEQILKEKDAIFQSTIADRVTIMDGAREILQLLQDANVPFGLDSSTSRENIDHILSSRQLQSFFRFITSGDTQIDEKKYGERKKKESRLRFLADQMGATLEKTIVVGDAEKDLTGAKKAGMKVIAIPNAYTKDNDFSLADARFTSLKEITLADFERLAA